MGFGTSKKIVLDLYQNRYVATNVAQYDIDSRELIVQITDDGQPYYIDSSVVKVIIKYKKSDGKDILNDCVVLEDGTIFIEFTDQMMVADGKCEAELMLINIETEAVIHTCHFIVNVRKSVFSNEEIESTDEFMTLEKALIKVETIDTTVNEYLEIVQETVENINATNEEFNEKIVEIENSENARVQSEIARQLAEIQREDAEDERKTNINTALVNMNNALTESITATTEAENATISANEATNKANASIKEVNTLIETMETLVANENLVHSNELGMPGGVAMLDENGYISTSQIPGFVDDVLDGTFDIDNNQFLDLEGNIYIPESGKLYIDVESRISYRWSGTTYVPLTSSVELGTTSSTAFPGDRGLANENRIVSLEEYHNNIPASDIKFNNTTTDLLSANVQKAIEELTNKISDQNHVHNNKSVLDNITSTNISTWNKVTNKVDKVNGKGLSTNDYTNEDKEQVVTNTTNISELQEDIENLRTTMSTTDENVKNTLSATTKFYLTGTSESSTNTGKQYFDTGVYVSANSGELCASSVSTTGNVYVHDGYISLDNDWALCGTDGSGTRRYIAQITSDDRYKIATGDFKNKVLIGSSYTTSMDLYATYIGLNGNVYIPNNSVIYAKDSGGNNRTIAKITSDDQYKFAIGDFNNTIQMGSSYTSKISLIGADVAAYGNFHVSKQLFANGNVYVRDGYIVLGNNQALYGIDSNDEYKSIAYITEDDRYKLATGTFTNKIEIGGVNYTTNIDLYSDAIKVNGTLTTSGNIFTGGYISLPNDVALYGKDSNGTNRLLAQLTSSNGYKYGTGGVSNTIQIGSSYTTKLELNGTNVAVTGNFHVSGNLYANGAYICIPNNSALYAKDSGGTDRTIAKITSSDKYEFATGNFSNTIKMGTGHTSQMLLVGAEIVCNTDLVRPYTNNKANLGNSTYRWKGIYSTTSVNVSSDRRLKDDIRNLDEKYIRLIEILAPKSFYYIYDDVETRRRRVGYVAQEVEEAALEVGLTLEDCNFIHKHWVEREDYTGYEYSLNYDDIAVIVHGKVRQQENRIKELEDEVLQLKELFTSSSI